MSRLLSVAALSAALALVGVAPAAREPVPAGVRVVYGPSPEAAAADVDALSRAKTSVDMAAYVLTDRTIVSALAAAAGRGVTVRIYLDRDELDRAPVRTLEDLATLGASKNVTIRAKARRTEAMHLKSYAIDRRLLRTGSANFSYSGERAQENDIVFLDGAALAGSFTRVFETMWTRADNESIGR